LFRELAIKIVADIPFTELQKLMKFKKTDPFSSESEEILQDTNQDSNVLNYEHIKIKLLQEQNLLLFEAECDLL